LAFTLAFLDGVGCPAAATPAAHRFCLLDDASARFGEACAPGLPSPRPRLLLLGSFAGFCVG
jgi:hypothetical protein